MLAGIWNHWTDAETGEIVPSYTMLTCNCDGHPLLGRLHKPDSKLPPDQQDKRAVVHLEPSDWSTWLSGSVDQARDLIRPAPAEFFDQADAIATDELLAAAQQISSLTCSNSHRRPAPPGRACRAAHPLDIL
ncbi:SOS response-associated peptidase family protein [Mitsuaria sp. CC2]|uniref:SOS response-associated peptidase family protein n=1 Tax=Mitsuaria sp. CC2 TaxID=3029186 RepID=UPI003BA3500A